MTGSILKNIFKIFLMMGHYIVHETTLMQRLLQLNVSVLIIMQIKKDSKLFYSKGEMKKNATD